MARPGTLPRFGTGAGALRTEPTEARKDVGALVNERLPAQMLNWLTNNIHDWMSWLNTSGAAKDEDNQWSATQTLAKAGGDSAAQLAHSFSVTAHKLVHDLSNVSGAGSRWYVNATGELEQAIGCRWDDAQSKWVLTAGFLGGSFDAHVIAWLHVHRFDGIETKGRISGNTAAWADAGWTTVSNYTPQHGLAPALLAFGSASQLTNSTAYLWPGSSDAVAQAADSARIVIPADGFISHLKAVTTAPGGATTATFTVRKNGVDTALTATITGAATVNTYGSSQNPVAGLIAVAAGDTISIKSVRSNGATAAAYQHASVFYRTGISIT